MSVQIQMHVDNLNDPSVLIFKDKMEESEIWHPVKFQAFGIMDLICNTNSSYCHFNIFELCLNMLISLLEKLLLVFAAITSNSLPYLVDILQSVWYRHGQQGLSLGNGFGLHNTDIKQKPQEMM